MSLIAVDFNKEVGKIKPMHCVNNGPHAQSNSNLEDTNFYLYKDLGIPFARNHDASFNARYGLEHTVDIHAVFPDFDADPDDPNSYDFTCTDGYIKVTELAGTHQFYRLGSRIEHEIKKYGTIMPKDFKKWAVICEHIIRHYTEGWSDGFYYDMPYWEIWNEADLDPDDSTNKRCWSGTAKEFYELFGIAFRHLKGCFPHLKIGGPAVANVNNEAWIRGFFESLGDIKLDFFSWHVYFDEMDEMLRQAKIVKNYLTEYGQTECESILNEWNYVMGNCWSGHGFYYSVETRIGNTAKCAAYTAAAMLAAQHSSIDMLMNYDARPSLWCSLFKPYLPFPQKSYYSLWMFNKLYRAGSEVETVVSGDNLYAISAKGENEKYLMLAYYNNDDSHKGTSVDIKLSGLSKGGMIETFRIDSETEGESVGCESLASDELTQSLDLKNNTVYLFKITD